MLIALVLIAIPAAIAGPKIFRAASEGIEKREQLRQPPIINSSAAGTWINPWLRDRAARMLNAASPLEWRGVSFQSGPCFSENLSLLPKDKWHQAIIDSCHNLDAIQARYASSCSEFDACVVPSEAKRELQGVIDYLVAEYLDAGLVQPYTTEEQSK
jgi:hypothetical protein